MQNVVVNKSALHLICRDNRPGVFFRFWVVEIKKEVVFLIQVCGTNGYRGKLQRFTDVATSVRPEGCKVSRLKLYCQDLLLTLLPTERKKIKNTGRCNLYPWQAYERHIAHLQLYDMNTVQSRYRTEQGVKKRFYYVSYLNNIWKKNWNCLQHRAKAIGQNINCW